MLVGEVEAGMSEILAQGPGGDRSGSGRRPGKRAEAKAVNREEILQAAQRVFATIGYESASVRDIIRETSLASGTFYNYFRSKEEVAEALMDESIARFRARLTQVRRKAVDFEAYVRGAFRAYFDFVVEEYDSAREQAVVRAGHLPSRGETPSQKAVFEEIRADLRAAHERGEVPGLDFGFFAAACVGMAREVGERMVRRDPVDPGAAASFCADAVFALLARGPEG